MVLPIWHSFIPPPAHQRKKAASDLILQLEADRVHTLIPGLLVLQHVFHLFQAQQLIVSKYGVREGYLCERVLKKCH
ncbi:hypothetical protein DW954_13890 [Clostridium sp. AM45-5]|nr:hypothetical protein DW954_13890 [Clostridium sp. AM45-5]